MNYLDFINNDLFNIVLSYLNYDNYINIIKVSSNINYYIISKLRFGVNFNNNEYLLHLSSEDFINKLKLKYSIDKLINLQELDLSYNQLIKLHIESGKLVN